MKNLRVVFMALGIIALLVITAVYLLSRDDPAPQDTDLQFIRQEVSKQENGFFPFMQAIQKMYWPKGKNEECLICDILEEKKWDENFVVDLLDKNKEAVSYLDKTLNHPYFQVPDSMLSPFAIVSYDTSPYFKTLISWRNLARLSSLKAYYLFKKGKEKAALDETIKIIKVGQMIESSQAGLITYMMGVSIKQIGVERFKKIITRTSLPSKILTQYELSNFRGGKSAGRFLKHNYWEIRNYLHNRKAIIEDLTKNAQSSRILATIVFKLLIANPYSYKPNTTTKLFAEAYRKLIQELPKPCSKRELLSPLFTNPLSTNPWLTILSPNGAGLLLLQLYLPNLNEVARQTCEKDFNVVGTQVLLALKCFKADTGRLPKQLEELVPNYITQIPKAPFDGEPLRYSYEEKVIRDKLNFIKIEF